MANFLLVAAVPGTTKRPTSTKSLGGRKDMIRDACTILSSTNGGRVVHKPAKSEIYLFI